MKPNSRCGDDGPMFKPLQKTGGSPARIPWFLSATISPELVGGVTMVHPDGFHK